LQRPDTLRCSYIAFQWIFLDIFSGFDYILKKRTNQFDPNQPEQIKLQAASMHQKGNQGNDQTEKELKSSPESRTTPLIEQDQEERSRIHLWAEI
jgi:hypothetical protein